MMAEKWKRGTVEVVFADHEGVKREEVPAHRLGFLAVNRPRDMTGTRHQVWYLTHAPTGLKIGLGWFGRGSLAKAKVAAENILALDPKLVQELEELREGTQPSRELAAAMTVAVVDAG